MSFNGEVLTISRTIVFFPFYLLGVYATNNHISFIRKQSKIIGLLIIIGTVVFVCSDFVLEFANLKYLLRGSKGFDEVGANMISIFIMKVLLTIVTLLLSLAIINTLPDKKSFSKLGQDSLFFYIYHVFLIKVSFYLFFGYLTIEPSLLNLLLTSLSIVITLIFLSKITLMKKILNPYSNFIKSKIKH